MEYPAGDITKRKKSAQSARGCVMGQTIERVAPVFLEHRTTGIPEYWFSGIQRFESIEQGIVRTLLYSNRQTPDGLPIRDPVVSLLCVKAAIVPCAREAIYFATGTDVFFRQH